MEQPVFLWLLALAIIPVMLYLFRRKSKQVNVSTLVFFKTLAREHQESAWLRRLKKWLSFLFTISVLLAATFALARLTRGDPGGGNFRTYVILLDRSASMSLENGSGVSRLEEAKQILDNRIQSIPEEIGVALVAYDNRPVIIQPRTMIRRELLSRLNEVKVRPIAGDPAAGLETAIMLAGLETPALILHASDFGDSTGLEAPTGKEITIEKINVAVGSPTNAGITSFQIRKAPLEQDSYDVHAQVTLNKEAIAPREVHLQLFVGGVPSQVRDFDLSPGGRETFEFRVTGAAGQILRMHISTDDDNFGMDDTVMAPLPEARPIVAVWIRENSAESPQDGYTSLALSSIQETGTLELLVGTPRQWPLKHEVDAIIFDGWLPDEWKADIPAIVINPPRNSGPVLARKLEHPIPYDSIRVGNEDHPVLFRVSSSRIALAQTALIQPSGSFEPLWLAGKEPVLVAGEVGGQRLVVMAFSPKISERLPLTASFPLLLGNSLMWVAEGSEEMKTRVRNSSTGEFADVDGNSLTWTDWHNDSLRRREFPLESTSIELDRIGIWQTDTDRKGISHLLSAGESNLPALPEDAREANDRIRKKSWFGSLPRFFIGLIVVVLLLESWLFHRHAVY